MDLLIPELQDGNGSQWMKSLETKLRHGADWKKAHYAARQAQVKQYYDILNLKDIGAKSGSPGYLRPIAVIDGHTYQKWQQEDEFFWEDDKNTQEFLRDNPECRVDREKAVQVST